MKVSDQTDSSASYALPLGVQLSPGFLAAIRAYMLGLPAIGSESAVCREGLLFGTDHSSSVTIQVFRCFPGQNSGDPGLSRRGEFDSAVQKLLASSSTDPETAALQLIGWYSVRPLDTPGLNPRDLAFHNRYFQHEADLGLVINPEPSATALLQLYARASDGPLSEQNRRHGLWRLDLQAEKQVSTPIDLTMSPADSDYHYARVYEVLSSLEESSARHWPERIIGSVLKPHGRRDGFGSPLDEHVPIVGAQVSDSRVSLALGQIHSAAPATRRESYPPAPVLSAVRPAPVQSSSKLALLSASALTLIAAGVALVWFFVHSSTPAFSVSRPSDPALGTSRDFGLRIEGEGDGMLVSWNRQSLAVRTASGGLLAIEDGPRHHRVVLTQSDIASGSILYRPESNDVNLALDLFTPQGPVTEHMRVLDGTRMTDRVSKPASLRSLAPSRSVAGQNRYRDAALTNKPASARTKIQNTASRSRPIGGGPANTPRLGQPFDTPRQPALASDRPTPEPAKTPASPEMQTRLQTTPVFRDESQGGPAVKFAALDTQVPSSAGVSPAATGAPLSHLPAKAGAHFPAVPGTPETSAPTLTRPPDSRPGLDYVQPRALKQVMPNTRLFGVTALDGGARDIAVTVEIDNRGHVTSVRALKNGRSNSSLMTSAALSAAKQWIFEPATLRGVSVPSEHTIVFRFPGRTP